ncbi:hypothetical protein HWV62_14536 [Athelia sp. TMB]|nr:hypothetical protein HWV62_14536 [Athelia sp. TMB]
MLSSIYHIMAFSYKPGTADDTKGAFHSRFMNLRLECKRDGREYIKDIQAGKAKPSEAHGLDNVLLFTFQTVEDSDYFRKYDPIYGAFLQEFFESGVLDKAETWDAEPPVWIQGLF